MTTVELLRAARAVIENPDDWTQGYSSSVPTCAVGALDIARGHPSLLDDPAYNALLAAVPGRGDVSWFNDTHTHAEVLSVFDKAIASVSA